MYKHPNKGTQILSFVPFPTQRTAPISRHKRLILNIVPEPHTALQASSKRQLGSAILSRARRTQ